MDKIQQRWTDFETRMEEHVIDAKKTFNIEDATFGSIWKLVKLSFERGYLSGFVDGEANASRIETQEVN